MYLRKCRHCKRICKIKQKHGKLCDDCSRMFEEIRVVKIKVGKYNSLLIQYEKRMMELEGKIDGAKQN